MKNIFTILVCFFSFNAYAFDDYSKDVLQNRIKPIGKVRTQEQKDVSAKVKDADKQKEATSKEETKERTGKKVYEQFCSICHRSGIAGAPRFRDNNDWGSLVDKMEISGLVDSAIKGKNAMPAKGTCVDCTKKEIKQAIEYMLPK